MSDHTETDDDGAGLGAPGADAGAGWIASDRVRLWARRLFAPSQDTSNDVDGGHHTLTHDATRRAWHPAAPHWPGAGKTADDAGDGEDDDGRQDNGRVESDDPERTAQGRGGQYQAGVTVPTETQPAVEEPGDTAQLDVGTQTDTDTQPDTGMSVTEPATPVTSPQPTAPTVPLPAPETTESSEPVPGHLAPESPAWPARDRRRGRRTQKPRGRGRTVSERLRHISPWSVFKVAALFYICVVITVLVASVFLWQIGRNTETIDQMESFVSRLFSYGECIPRDEVDPGTTFQLDDDCPEGSVLVGGFEIDDGTLFRSVLIGGGVFVGAATLGTVLLVVLFNLLSDVTGGVRYTVARGSVGATSGSTHREKQR